MNNNLGELIRKYSQSGILVDTNILLLLLVGNVDPDMIPRFKRTSQFVPEDYELLKRLLALFIRIVVTPNILSEVSNLAGQMGEPVKSVCFSCFFDNIEVMKESYVESRIVSRDHLVRFGLTDSTTFLLSSQPILVLTDDFRLSNYMSHHGLDVINFNHIRVAAWF
jgi:hypothetical protein